MHLLVGKLDFSIAHVLRGVEFDLLISHHLGGDGHLSMFGRGTAFPFLLKHIQSASFNLMASTAHVDVTAVLAYLLQIEHHSSQYR